MTMPSPRKDFRTATPPHPPAVEPLEPRMLLDGDALAPAAPSDLAVTGLGFGTVDIAWSDNADNETGYRIERARLNGPAAGIWEALDTVGPDVTAWRDYRIDRGVRYAWRVTAVGAEADSTPSQPVQAEGTWPFVPVRAGLPLVEGGAVAWADFDADGDEDVVLTGTGRYGEIAEIYRNDDGVFVGAPAELPPVTHSAVAWGDFDADGDLDLVLNGQGPGGFHAAVFRNDGGTFVDLHLPLTGGAWGDVAWVDYDVDGDLDAVLFGSASGADSTVEFCRNDGDGWFSVLPASLPAVLNAAAAWGDYDADGDADLLLAGRVGPDNLTGIYRNDGGGRFTDIAADLEPARDGTAQWGDFDADGDLDALLAGRTARGQFARVYENHRGSFRPARALPDGLPARDALWADYDIDGDLDILAHTSLGDLRLYTLEAGFYAAAYDLPAPEGTWGDVNADGYPDVAVPETGPLAAETLLYRNVAMPSAVLTAGARIWRFDTPDGGRATVRLAGPGRAEIRVDPFGRGDLASITLHGTTDASALSITVNRARSTVRIGDIAVYGSLGRLTAPRAVVRGTLTVTGTARYVRLAGLEGARMALNTYRRPLERRDRARLDLGTVADSIVETGGVPVATLKLVEWLDADGDGDDALSAPWVGSVRVTGRPARPAWGQARSEGHFQAALRPTGAAPNGRAVGSVRIAGTLSGTWDFTVPEVGRLGVVRAGAADGWELNAPAVDVISITVAAGLAGRLEAWRFGRVSVGGVVSAAVHAVGTDRGGVSLGQFSAGAVRDAELTAAGGIRSVRVGEWLRQDGAADDRPDRISAAWVGSLRTVRLPARPAIARPATEGDFQADLAIDVTASARPRRFALSAASIRGTVRDAAWDILGRAGTLRVRGDWADSTCYVSGPLGRVVVTGTAASTRIAAGGSIGSLLLGASDGSDFLAGVAGPADPAGLGLYDIDVASRIGSVRIIGWRLPHDQDGTRFVRDSRFVAASVGIVDLTNPAPDGYRFTLLGGQGHIRSLRVRDRTDPAGRFAWRPGRPYPEQWLGATPWDVL